MEHAVATREQLTVAGFSAGQVNAQITGRRWRRLNDDVIALHNGPLTAEQSQLAVWLSAPHPSALAGLTAASLGGLRGFETEVVHILVRRGARVLPVPGVAVAVHESRRFSADDVWTQYAPARVRLTRAVIDAAAWSAPASYACRIVAATVQQRLATPSDLYGELELAGKVRHRCVLRLLLRDLDGGAQALSEVEFLRFCRRHGFPRPELNVRTDAGGRRRYLDAVFRLPNGKIVRVEIDGGIHLSLNARASDNRRDNAFVLANRPVLRFASIDIYVNHPEVVAQLRAALGVVSA